MRRNSSAALASIDDASKGNGASRNLPVWAVFHPGVELQQTPDNLQLARQIGRVRDVAQPEGTGAEVSARKSRPPN